MTLVLFPNSVLNENNLVLFQVIIISSIVIVIIKMIFKYLLMKHTASFLLNDPFEFYIIFITLGKFIREKIRRVLSKTRLK